MSVAEDFLVAFVALHADPASRSAVVAALPEWSKSNESILDLVRRIGALDSRKVAELEATVRSRLAHFDGDANRAFEGLFRSLFQLNNRDRSRSFFLALTDGDGSTPKSGLAMAHVARFRRERVHAVGGLGQVWLAQDPILGRRIALKEIRPELRNRPELVQRFVREAKITGRLQHPNIVPILEFSRGDDDSDSCPSYAMRFVEGTTLADEIRVFHIERRSGKFDRLAFSRLLDAFVDVCQAIAYAHTHGVLHRDLKPDNVMLGQFGEVVVLDWGLAKEFSRDQTSVTFDESSVDGDDAAETKAGSAIGTPGYMAPEQASGRRDAYSEQTDVYGLGAILFAILTGRAAHEHFPGETLHDMLARVAVDPTPNARDVEPRVSRTLNAICARAMAFRPEGRYAKASDLARDVERWSAGEPIQGYREPLSQRIARWVIRRQRVVSTVGGCLLATLLIFVVARAHAAVSLQSHLDQQAHESRDAALSFSHDMLRAAERITAESRFLGELGSVIQFVEAERASDKELSEKARHRVEQGLSAFARRRRNCIRVSLVSFVNGPKEVVAYRRIEGGAAPDLGTASADYAESAARGAKEFRRLGADLAYLDRIAPFNDPHRSPRLVWPRIRLIAPVAVENPETGGAVVLEVAYGLFNPQLAPEIDRERENLEMDWFLVGDRGDVLWCDPGRYSQLAELRAGESITDHVPELSHYFADPPLDGELEVGDSAEIASMVYARPMRSPYFYPIPRFLIVAATPLSHLKEVAQQQQSTVIYATIIVIVVGVGAGMLAISTLAGIARQANRGYD